MESAQNTPCFPSQEAADEQFMREALAEARLAAQEGEVPIGAVVVCGGEVVARAHNRREALADPSAHAEFSAMVEAARALGRWRLAGCTVYVTLEPCAMCAGLMVNARIDRCVYGAADPKGGALGSLYDLSADGRLNHSFTVTPSVLEGECATELKRFFARVRGDRGEAEAAARADERRSLAEELGARSAGDRQAAGSDARPSFAPRVLLAIDSFKGSATSEQAELWVEEGILRTCPSAAVTRVAIGDGGEGTVAALAAARQGKMRVVAARSALGDACRASYLMFDGPDGPAAAIEVAEVAGIARSDRSEDAARSASTYGVGEMVLDAVRAGAGTVYLCLGGSATSDGGAGFLRALGAAILDEDGRDVPEGLSGVERTRSIDLAPAAAALGATRFVALADVDNPLVGRRGAISVFGPQKGLPADPGALAGLDRAMVRYGSLLDEASRKLGDRAFRSLAGVPGAGAAGGMGAAVLALGGELASGIDAVLDAAGFDELALDADLVVTGEGSMDGQTLGGKAPLGVARRAKRAGCPVVALVGGRQDDLDAVYRAGIDLVLPVLRRPMPAAEAMEMEQARANLVAAGEAVVRSLSLGRRG